MAATETAINACDVVVHLETHDQVLHDISGSSNRVEFAFTRDLQEFSVFGQTWKQRMGCKLDGTVNLAVVYSGAALEGWAVLKDWWFNYPTEHRRLRVMIPDDSIGSDDFDGEFILSSLNVPSDASQAGPIVVTATLMQTGGVTLGVVAT